MLLPMVEINKAVHVVGKKIIERSHSEKEKEQPNDVPNNLNYWFEIHQPMRPQKNQNDKKAKCFKKKHRIPQNVVGRVNKLPFDDRTRCEIDKIP